MISSFHNIPLPESLRGNELGTFTYDSVVNRMPNIGRQMLADNDFPPEVTANLEALLEQIPTGKIRPMMDESAPDASDWLTYVAAYIGQNWLDAPWFFVETYFYRRILEATGYFLPGLGQGVDQFLYQKRRGLELGREAIRVLAEQLQPQLMGEIQDREGLATLLAVDLWGNQADLSLWPAGSSEQPGHADINQQQAHTLVDDSLTIIDYLFNQSEKIRRIDIILDNAGFELVTDLFLAAYLLKRDISGTVILHAKSHPTFVSDAMIKDVRQTVSALTRDDHPGVVSIARMLQRMLDDGRLQLREDWFWTSPLEMWHMPRSLRDEIAGADLLISKGDANYRRLLGDRHWSLTTKFADVVRYAPAPVVALRTLKSEVAVGLKPGQAETVAEEDARWQVDGRWGVIQFWDGKSEG